MIKNYNQFNESLLTKLEGPTPEESWSVIKTSFLNDANYNKLYRSLVNLVFFF